MSTLRYTDIDYIQNALTQLATPDASVDEAARFIGQEGAKLTAMLDELTYLRERNASGQDGGHAPNLARSHRFRAEGRSATSAEKALARALSSAAHFFSEHNDVLLTLAELVHQPDGIWRAVVEVHITLFSKGTDARKHTAKMETKHEDERAFAAARKLDARRTTQMIFDHFMHVRSGAPGNLPASFLVNITDAGLLNKMIEKQFFKSTHPDSTLLPPTGQPFTMLVRARDPDELEPKP